MLQPWESTPLQKLLDKAGDVVAWLVQFAVTLSFLAIPVLIAIVLIHFLAKYW